MAIRSCGDLALLGVVGIGSNDEIPEFHLAPISSTQARHRDEARMNFMQEGSKIKCCTLCPHAGQPGDEDGEGLTAPVLDRRMAIFELVQAAKRSCKRNATAGLKLVDDR